MPRWFIVLAAIVLLVLGAALMHILSSGSTFQFAHRDDIGPSEFISIILTALGVILAAMAIMLGALAIVGWSSIQSQVENKADAISKDFLRERFSDGNPDYLQFVEDLKEDIRARLIGVVQEDDPENRLDDPNA
jgi:uncharacterized membrane protein